MWGSSPPRKRHVEDVSWNAEPNTTVAPFCTSNFDPSLTGYRSGLLRKNARGSISLLVRVAVDVCGPDDLLLARARLGLAVVEALVRVDQLGQALDVRDRRPRHVSDGDDLEQRVGGERRHVRGRGLCGRHKRGQQVFDGIAPGFRQVQGPESLHREGSYHEIFSA
ncbi:hypothetical protein KL929_004163 [Ogataea haglerorum]|nr:hypothetical protein KL929_004163 [Ogataea haglerorum]